MKTRKPFLAATTAAIVLAVIALSVLPGCGNKAPKLSPREQCYDIQRSIQGAIKAFYTETGKYPGSLEELKEHPRYGGSVAKCPAGGGYIWISGDPPQVRCNKHGFSP